MARYKLKAGRHVSQGAEGRVYNPGDVVEAKEDLVAIHGSNKFEQIHTQDPIPRSDPQAVQAAVDSATAGLHVPEGDPAPKAPPVAIGTDITGDFPTAEEADLLVFKRGRSYFVCRPANPAEALNEEPLTNKEAVLTCIEANRAKPA